MSEENRIDSGARRGQSSMPWVILAIVVLLVVIVGVLFRDKIFPKNSDKNAAQQAEQKPSGYQAVFLSNGQVYFGKLSDTSASYVTLKDIYYIQVNQPQLQGAAQTAAQAAQSNAQTQLLLVKLGNELHGPVDEMKINRDQILFYEDIKEDGTVAKKIREYQANPPKADATQTPAAQTPATTPSTTPNK